MTTSHINDDGIPTAIRITLTDGAVCVNFNKEVRWFAMLPEEAYSFATAIIQAADSQMELMRKQKEAVTIRPPLP